MHPQKIILTFILFFITFFIYSNESYAYQVNLYNDIGNVTSNAVFNNTANDEIRLSFKSQTVYSHSIQFYTTENYPNIKGTFKEATAKDGFWFVGFGLTCVGYYEYKAYDKNKKLVLDAVIQVEENDLKNPRCDSSGDDEGNQSNPTQECASMICQCISDLKPTLNSIDSSLKDANVKLDSLNQTTKEIKSSITNFHDEFKTDKNYTIPSFPDTSQKLNENKPSQPSNKFIDTNTYFKDNGDAVVPGKLPKAPEPKDWDGFLRENEKQPDLPLNQDAQQKKDLEINLDQELIKDNQLITDQSLLKDQEMNKSNELIKDQFIIDQQLNQDVFILDQQLQTDQFSQTENFIKSSELNKTNQFNQTNIFP